MATNPAPYLDETEIAARLTAQGLTATVTPVVAAIASDELDSRRPFIGGRYGDQLRQFPRSVEPDGSDSDGTIPDAILDAVALLAYALILDEGPPVKEEAAGGVSVVYAYPKTTITQHQITELVRPYQVTRGRM